MTDFVMDDNDKQREPENGRYRNDMHRRRRGRNIALGLLLAVLAVLFYVVAIVKMGGS